LRVLSPRGCRYVIFYFFPSKRRTVDAPYLLTSISFRVPAFSLQRTAHFCTFNCTLTIQLEWSQPPRHDAVRDRSRKHIEQALLCCTPWSLYPTTCTYGARTQRLSHVTLPLMGLDIRSGDKSLSLRFVTSYTDHLSSDVHTNLPSHRYTLY